MAITAYLTDAWSVTDFRSAELDGYAEDLMRLDTRRGVQILALLSLLMHLCLSIIVVYNAVGSLHLYTHLMLAILSVHILVSVSFVPDIRTMQVLGMLLLIVSALAITLLAHRSGDLNTGMMAAVIMLFIAIPLVPWALRETVVVIGLTFLLITSSLMSVPGRFESDALWALQLLILGSTIVVAVLVCRNTYVRKQEIRMRFELENAHREMEMLSMKDHLTGAWNRRYLDDQFPAIAEKCRLQNKTLHIAVLDIDNFKGINDSYGHQLADQVLICLGRIFEAHLGDDGCLIRLGGDEFQILYCGDDLEGVIAEAVAELQSVPVARRLRGKRQITLSAGFSSTGPEEFADLNTLYKIADNALYSAKQYRKPGTQDNGVDPFARTGAWKL